MAGSGGRGSRIRGKRPTARFRSSGAGTTLMLSSMLDILMSVLFFLLKNYSAVTADFALGKDITLPSSSALNPPAPALQLVVTKKAITLDDKEIVPIVNGEISRKDLHTDGVTILKLAWALKEQRRRAEFFQSATNTASQEAQEKDKSFIGSIVMQADKDTQFAVLKKVIYTAGISDFVMFKLAVLKHEEG